MRDAFEIVGNKAASSSALQAHNARILRKLFNGEVNVPSGYEFSTIPSKSISYDRGRGEVTNPGKETSVQKISKYLTSNNIKLNPILLGKSHLGADSLKLLYTFIDQIVMAQAYRHQFGNEADDLHHKTQENFDARINSYLDGWYNCRRLLVVQSKGDGACWYNTMLINIIYAVLTDKIIENNAIKTKLFDKLIAKKIIKDANKNDDLKTLVKKLLASFSQPAPTLNSNQIRASSDKQLITSCNWHALQTKCSPSMYQIMLDEWRSNQHVDNEAKKHYREDFINFIIACKNILSDTFDSHGVNGILTYFVEVSKTKAIELWGKQVSDKIVELRKLSNEQVRTQVLDDTLLNFSTWWKNYGKNHAMAKHSPRSLAEAGNAQIYAIVNAFGLNVKLLNTHNGTISDSQNFQRGSTEDGAVTLYYENKPGHFNAVLGDPTQELDDTARFMGSAIGTVYLSLSRTSNPRRTRPRSDLVSESPTSAYDDLARPRSQSTPVTVSNAGFFSRREDYSTEKTREMILNFGDETDVVATVVKSAKSKLCSPSNEEIVNNLIEELVGEVKNDYGKYRAEINKIVEQIQQKPISDAQKTIEENRLRNDAKIAEIEQNKELQCSLSFSR